MYSKAWDGFHFHLNTSGSETVKDVPHSYLSVYVSTSM